MGGVAVTEHEHRTAVDTERSPQGKWEHRAVCLCGWRGPRSVSPVEAQKYGLIHEAQCQRVVGQFETDRHCASVGCDVILKP